MCPDSRIGGRNDVTLISGQRQDGVTTVTYRRPLQTNEAIKDRAIPPHGLVNVIAAIGPLNTRKEANAHGIPDKTAGQFIYSCFCIQVPSFLMDIILRPCFIFKRDILFQNLFGCRFMIMQFANSCKTTSTYVNILLQH